MAHSALVSDSSIWLRLCTVCFLSPVANCPLFWLLCKWVGTLPRYVPVSPTLDNCTPCCFCTHPLRVHKPALRRPDAVWSFPSKHLWLLQQTVCW